MVRAEIERQNPVGIAGQSEKRRLTETQRPAIAPDQAETESHEHPIEEIDRVSDGVGILNERVAGRQRDDYDEAGPEQPAATERLRTLEQRKDAQDERGLPRPSHAL